MKKIPEIQATPYSRHIPERYVEESRLEKTYIFAKHLWENRPGMLEFNYFTLPWILALGGVAINVTDGVLGTHFGTDMANVKVEPHSNDFYQVLEESVHQIGKNSK